MQILHPAALPTSASSQVVKRDTKVAPPGLITMHKVTTKREPSKDGEHQASKLTNASTAQSLMELRALCANTCREISAFRAL
jgi:hypothetical protein